MKPQKLTDTELIAAYNTEKAHAETIYPTFTEGLTDLLADLECELRDRAFSECPML